MISGRVQSFRTAGSKLVFVDLIQDGQRVQGLCNLRKIGESAHCAGEFQLFQHLLHRGDILCEYILSSKAREDAELPIQPSQESPIGRAEAK